MSENKNKSVFKKNIILIIAIILIGVIPLFSDIKLPPLLRYIFQVYSSPRL